MTGFFVVHRDLPREGPGEPADVHWVLGQIVPPARVCDAACGPGADLVTLAEALPGAQIDGVDRQAHFVATARQRVARFGPRVSVVQADYAGIVGSYDLIWCAGAVYFLGIERALAVWRGALAPGGRVAFSEPVWVGAPSASAREFWRDYPAITDATGIDARVTAARFRTLATRLIVGPAWAAYSEPMEARLALLRPGADDDQVQAIADAVREIALWRENPGQIAYLLSLVAPS